MATYNTPGVYIQEIPKLPASVAQVATAIPAFIGYTENGSLLRIPTRIQSFLEYEQLFGGPNANISVTLTMTETSPGPPPVIKNEITLVDVVSLQHNMYYALQMYFANGGGPCYIVCAGTYPDIPEPTVPPADPVIYVPVNKTDLKLALDTLEKEDEPTLIVYPDAVSITAENGTLVSSKALFHDLCDETLTLCATLQDRFAIFDTYLETGNPDADATEFRNNNVGSNNLKYGAVYYPKLLTTLNYDYTNSQVIFKHVDSDAPDTPGPLDGHTLAELIAGAQSSDNSNHDNPLYLQHDLLKDLVTENFLAIIKAGIARTQIILPPSSAIAGVYAAVDASRGVWKAPANVSLTGVVAPTVKVTDETQQTLNIDATSGKSVNAIRSFTGKGILVWGARTLAGNDNEWKFINVRRLFITAEESIKKATAFVVFEPNDANTWVRVKAMIENYLTGLWRDGALAGATPQEAFFVNVGLGTTMTSDDILEGKLNIEVGMAATRPAEFIVLSFSHKLQTS